jgi:hypothetical protein
MPNTLLSSRKMRQSEGVQYIEIGCSSRSDSKPNDLINIGAG